MSKTTDNQFLLVATTKTPTVAKTKGVEDVHINNKGVKIPHPNSVSTKKSLPGTTTTGSTLIDGAFIVLQDKTSIGPPSNSVWPGEVGEKSGVTGMEARVTKGSGTVKAEKLPIARYSDPTTQNKGNCPGTVEIDDPTIAAQQLEKQKLLRCSMDSIVADDGGRLSKDKLLEVLAGSVVKLTATRVNGTEFDASGKPMPPPVCGAAPKHTHWIISRDRVPAWLTGAGFGAPSPLKQPLAPLDEVRYDDKQKGVDTITLGNDWTGKDPGEVEAGKPNWDYDNSVGGTARQQRDGAGLATGDTPRAQPDRRDTLNQPAPVQGENRVAGPTGRPPNPPEVTPASLRADFARSNAANPPKKPLNAEGLTANQARTVRRADSRMAQYEAKRQAYEGEQRRAADAAADRAKADRMAKGGKADRAAWQTLGNFIELFKAQPITITVTGRACAGPDKVDVKVYPKGRFALDIGQLVEYLTSKFGWFKTSVYIFENFCRLAGKDTFKINFLVGTKGRFEWEWVELPGNLVGKSFLVECGVEKLIEFVAEFRVAIISFLGPLGKFAAWLLEKINVRGDIGTEIGLFIGVNIAGEKLAGQDFKPGSVRFEVVFELGVFAELTAGDNFELKISVKAVWKPQFNKQLEMKINDLAMTKLEAGFVEFKVEFVAKADIWGLRGGKQFDLEIGKWDYAGSGFSWAQWLPWSGKK